MVDGNRHQNRTLITELAAAVEARARALQLRQIRAGTSSKPDPARPGNRIVTQGRTMRERIALREAISLDAIRLLREHAPVLIADRAELKDTRAALRRLKRTFRQHATAHHAAHDLPAHRPGEAERQFRADVQAISKRHRIGATEAATLIVQNIAPTLPKGARTSLLGSWRTERGQIRHLADILRKPA